MSRNPKMLALRDRAGRARERENYVRRGAAGSSSRAIELEWIRKTGPQGPVCADQVASG